MWYYLFIIIIIILVWLFTPASKPGSLKMHPARWAEHLSTIQLGDKHYVESAETKRRAEDGTYDKNRTPKEGTATERSHDRTMAHISHASKAVLEVLQARLQ